ncbi:RNA polymerase sigma factor [Arenimonas sp. MALMAid1274]|uniref:RNA polymerase sigma factor n=1 Tax=Arenimonas sp. MALMAid1274 TaxID=3411630 RepID=UPI003B9DE9A0
MTPDLLNTLIARDLPAAQRGDTVAYGRLVSATQRMVASVALAVTRDVQTSEDIAQETYLTAWQRLSQLGNPGGFLPWLRQVARNRAIDHVRAQRYRETPVDPLDPLATVAADTGAGPAETFERNDQARLLAEALDEIPETSRDVLLLFYREGERTQVVAALLGISDAAVRKRLQRGRESLREELLKRVADAARASAPALAFTVSVGTAVALSAPATAAATGAGMAKTGALGAMAKLSTGAVAAMLASVGIVVAAVVFETRIHLAKARSPGEHRSLLHNGIVYGALMGSYMVVLSWSVYAGWPTWQIMGTAVGFSAALMLLTYERRRMQRRHRRDAPDGSPGAISAACQPPPGRE